MIKNSEVKSARFTTTYCQTEFIHDDTSAVRWFRHVLELDVFRDVFTVYLGSKWTNDLESTGDTFSPEAATERRLMDAVKDKSPRFLEVTVNYDDIRCIIGVDLYKNMAYITMRNKDLEELPWLIKLLPG